MTAVNMKYENWYVWILLNTTLIKFTKPCRLNYIKQLFSNRWKRLWCQILPCFIRRINSPRVSDIHCQVFCFKMWQKTASIIYKQGDGFLSTIRRSMGWLINIWRLNKVGSWFDHGKYRSRSCGRTSITSPDFNRG